jgi:hypothetical protein
MATSSTTSPVTRETPARVRDKGSRAIIARIEGELLILRAKGLRSNETLHLGALYEQAVKARVFKARMDKAKSRRARKGR